MEHRKVATFRHLLWSDRSQGTDLREAAFAWRPTIQRWRKRSIGSERSWKPPRWQLFTVEVFTCHLWTFSAPYLQSRVVSASLPFYLALTIHKNYFHKILGSLIRKNCAPQKYTYGSHPSQLITQPDYIVMWQFVCIMLPLQLSFPQASVQFHSISFLTDFIIFWMAKEGWVGPLTVAQYWMFLYPRIVTTCPPQSITTPRIVWYIPFHCHHHLRVLTGVMRGMRNRVLQVCDDTTRPAEIQHLEEVFTANGLPEQVVNG